MEEKEHDFIFSPGDWIGEGTVTFSTSPEQVFFITKWGIGQESEEGIICEQEVKTEGAEDKVINRFQLFELSPTSFAISLENEAIGQVIGTGIIDERTIAWEFRGQIGFQGYEVYEKQKDGEYSFHAEYTSLDQLRTIIDGRIQRKEK